MSTAQHAGDAAPLPVADEACNTTGNSGPGGLQPSLTRNRTQGVADAPEQEENVTVVLSGTGVEASEAAVLPGRGVDRAVDVSGEAPATTSRLVCLDSTSLEKLDSFEKSVAAWAQSAVAALETTTDARRRIAVRDEAVRVAALAAAAGAGVALALAHDILQRAIRSIGQTSRRRRAGRPPSTGDEPAPHPVRGDTAATPEATDGGPHVDGNRSPGRTNTGDNSTPAAGDEATPHPDDSPHVDGNRSPGRTNTGDNSTPAAGDEATPHPVRGDTAAASEATDDSPYVDGNRSPGRTNTGESPTSTTGDLPRATRSAYRKDAESITDPGFEGISASVRAAAAADPAAGHKLDRGLVRAAGAVEDAGGDPGDLQVVEAKKQELSDARKRSRVDEAADDHLPCDVSPRIIEVVRKILGDRIDLDPTSTAEQNRHARARVFFDGTGTSLPGLQAAWPKNARVWVHVPRGADAAVFVQRVLTHAEGGAPVVMLTQNTTHVQWAQALLGAAAAVCFIAGDTTVQRSRTDDPSVVEVEEAPARQGQMLVGLNVDRKAFEDGCAGLGVSFRHGTGQDGHRGILGAVRLRLGRKTMPAAS